MGDAHSKLCKCALPCSATPNLLLVAAPALTNAWPMITNRPTTGNSIITVTGLAFGLADLTATGRVMTSVTCSTLAWTSGTTLQCDPGSFTAGLSLVAISINRLVGTRTVALSFDGALAFALLSLQLFRRMAAALSPCLFGFLFLQRRWSREYGGRTFRKREVGA